MNDKAKQFIEQLKKNFKVDVEVKTDHLISIKTYDDDTQHLIELNVRKRDYITRGKLIFKKLPMRKYDYIIG